MLAAALTALMLIVSATSLEAGDGSERGLAMSTEYSQLTVSAGETARMKLRVENQGRRDEKVYVTLSRVPTGWTARIRGGESAASDVLVLGGKTHTLTFTAEPAKGLRPGTYAFEVEATTADRALTATQDIVVTTGN